MVQYPGGAGAPYGFINTQGEYVFVPQWSWASSFALGFATVTRDVGDVEEDYCINLQGEVVYRELAIR